MNDTWYNRCQLCRKRRELHYCDLVGLFTRGRRAWICFECFVKDHDLPLPPGHSELVREMAETPEGESHAT